MSSLEWSDDEEQAVDVPAPSNFSIAYTMATDDCIPLKSSLMGQSSMMAQPVGPGPVEGDQVEVEEEEEKTEATPQAPEEKAEFKTPQVNGTGEAEASATHGPTEIDTTSKQAASPTSDYDMLEKCDNDAEIARNLQQELDAEAVDYQNQLQKVLGRMDGSMTGWDFREELLTEEAPKCEVLEIEDEENEADDVNSLKARFCESVQRSNYKKREQMKEEVAIGSENSEGDEPGKKKMKTHEKEVAEVKEVADEEIKQEVADEEIKQGVAEEQKKQEVAEEKKKEVADEEIKQGVAEEEKKQEVAEEEKKKEVAEKEEKKNAAKKEKKKKIAEEKKKKEVAEEEKKKKVAEEKKKKEVAEEEKKKKVAEEKKKEEVAEEEKKEEVAEEAPKVKAMPKKRVQRTTPEDDGQDGTQRKKKKGPTKQDAKEGDRETKSKELNEANTKKSSEQAESKEHDEEGKEHDEEQKGKNELLLDDPRYKKGTKMNDLSPQGQANLKEVRRLRAIQNSNAWHKKYPNGKGNKGVAGDTEAEGAKPDRAAEGEAEVAEVAEAASSSSKPAKTHTLKDAKVAWLT